MKKIILFIFIITNLVVFAVDINDYMLFDNGMKDFNNKNYKKAIEKFKKINIEYKKSNLIKSTYLYYYIGLSYYYTGNYETAIKFLKQTKYIPLEADYNNGYFKKNKKSYFEYEKNYYIAYSYLKMNNYEKAKEYFLKLYIDYFDIDIIKYEKTALKELIKLDKYYRYVFNTKYNIDENYDNLKIEDRLKLAKYFKSKGEYYKASILYRKYLENKSDMWANISVLKMLYYSKHYNELIEISKLYLKDKNNKKIDSYIYYYLASGYRRKGDLDNAITYFKNVKEGYFKKESIHLIGRMYYFKKDYDNAEKYLLQSNKKEAYQLLYNIYFSQKKYKELKKLLVNYIKNNPYSELSAFYRYKLYSMEKQGYLDYIIFFNQNTYYYEKAIEIKNYKEKAKDFPIQKYNEKYKRFNTRIEKILELNNPLYLKIELKYYDFSPEDDLYKKYLISKVFEKNTSYNEAIRNSLLNYRKFYNYKELKKMLYPKYYQKIVSKYSKKYGIEEELIYSIIKQESLFGKSLVSRASAYGLMQIILPTAKMFDNNITIEKLLEPDTNIKIGTQYLKWISDRVNGNISQIAASYNAGIGNVLNWLKEKNGDLIIEKIPYTETRGYVEKVLNNYYKYKRIYSN
ncbi:soluble lytic murein transglycosylase [Hypnocyclicus thermotrophus]|uniref:Soluble lytic murein transglycosylase n=1 Tax=Hypnocyclicus thermotrophus TaxID=1627895 RepID=A0AA46I5X0_9FUSO|nr:lytic transglycosylase domain-containing protein [Hypnocyclicus thermotrophus]TDT71579.1 soluble lytic murein transglycosylase [Hypnocyclicus thermotrophus]